MLPYAGPVATRDPQINAATGLVLDTPHEAERGTWPVVWGAHKGENQHWLLAMPFAAPPDYSASDGNA